MKVRIILKKDFTEFINTQPNRIASFLTEVNNDHFVNAAILSREFYTPLISQKFAGSERGITLRSLIKNSRRLTCVWKSRKPESGIGTGMETGTGTGTGTVM